MKKLKGLNVARILLIFGKGGHTTQMLRLLKRMPKRHTYAYVLCQEDPVAEFKVRGRVYKVTRPAAETDSVYAKIFKSLRCSLQALRILLADRPDVIISAGPGVGAIFSYIAKILGKKVVFIESWARVSSKSASGKLVYPVADLFFVQWPEMLKLYPRAIYAGRLG
jgi:UDP-N-acetylglucosamine:LPS N-acetylglucosamine transferase